MLSIVVGEGGMLAAASKNVAWLLLLCSICGVAAHAGGQPAKPAAPKPCDTRVHPDDSHFKYKRRGNVCEGAIREQIAAESIALRSFTQSLAYEGKNTTLDVSWTAPATTGEVRVESRDIKAGSAWEMNSDPLQPTARLSWKVSSAEQLGLAPKQLGVITYWEGDYLGSKRRIYLPARVDRDSHPKSAQYELVVLIGRPVSALNVSLHVMGADSKFLQLMWLKPFGVRDGVARVVFDRPQQRGVYRILIEGKVEGSTHEQVTERWLFYEGGTDEQPAPPDNAAHAAAAAPFAPRAQEPR
jgi:hypothetical protein